MAESELFDSLYQQKMKDSKLQFRFQLWDVHLDERSREFLKTWQNFIVIRQDIIISEKNTVLISDRYAGSSNNP